MGAIPRADFDRLKDLMACPVIVDLRNIYRPEDMQRRALPIPVWAFVTFSPRSMSRLLPAGPQLSRRREDGKAPIGRYASSAQEQIEIVDRLLRPSRS